MVGVATAEAVDEATTAVVGVQKALARAKEGEKARTKSISMVLLVVVASMLLTLLGSSMGFDQGFPGRRANHVDFRVQDRDRPVRFAMPPTERCDRTRVHHASPFCPHRGFPGEGPIGKLTPWHVGRGDAGGTDYRRGGGKFSTAGRSKIAVATREHRMKQEGIACSTENEEGKGWHAPNTPNENGRPTVELAG